MLTSERPFSGELATVSGTTSVKIRWEQLNLNALPPSRINPKISPELDALVLKALAKDKSKRFQDVGEFLVALSKVFTTLLEQNTIIKNSSASSEEKHVSSNTLPPDILPKDNLPSALAKNKKSFLIIGIGTLALVGVFLFFSLVPKPESIVSHEKSPLTAITIDVFEHATTMAQEAAISASQTAAPTRTKIPTKTPISTKTPSPTPIPCLDAYFVKDVNYPDDTEVTLGESFTKIWQIQNVGSCTWTSDYLLMFYSGDQMSAPYISPIISGIVRPKETVEVAVNLIAPYNAGTYQGKFMLLSSDGTSFGLGGERPFWVQVKVFDSSLENYFTVYANQGWQDSGVYLSQGDVVQAIYQSGQWRIADWDEYTDARGSNRFEGYTSDFHHGALIARSGYEESLIPVLNEAYFTATNNGPLFFRINDADEFLFDNNGSISVFIKVTH